MPAKITIIYRLQGHIYVLVVNVCVYNTRLHIFHALCLS